MASMRLLLLLLFICVTTEVRESTAQERPSQQMPMEQVAFFDNLNGNWKLSEINSDGRPLSWNSGWLSDGICDGKTFKYAMELPPVLGRTRPSVPIICHIQEIDFENGIFKIDRKTEKSSKIMWGKIQGDELLIIYDANQNGNAPEEFVPGKGNFLMTWNRRE